MYVYNLSQSPLSPIQSDHQTKMSLFQSLTLFLFISLFPISFSNTLTEDLIHLQSTSPNGIIHLNDLLISRILSASPLPFSLLIFFDAQALQAQNPNLNLKTLKQEFSLVSHSYVVHHQNDVSQTRKDLIFFCDVEFGESRKTFEKFEINALPAIRLVPVNAKNVKYDSIPMSPADFSEGAESMKNFVENKVGVTIGEITRPPLISDTQKVIILCGFLVMIPFMVKKLILGDTLLHDYRMWLAGAVFVYFFSVSGAMFNIIRKMPMFIPDRNDPSKMMFFYQGSGMQLGAEGFSIGALYTVVGLLLAGVTQGLVKVKNVTFQRVVMVFAFIVSVLAVRMVVSLDNWKTGYGIHMYWPTGWQ